MWKRLWEHLIPSFMHSGNFKQWKPASCGNYHCYCLCQILFMCYFLIIIPSYATVMTFDLEAMRKEQEPAENNKHGNCFDEHSELHKPGVESEPTKQSSLT